MAYKKYTGSAIDILINQQIVPELKKLKKDAERRADKVELKDVDYLIAMMGHADKAFSWLGAGNEPNFITMGLLKLAANFFTGSSSKRAPELSAKNPSTTAFHAWLQQNSTILVNALNELPAMVKLPVLAKLFNEVVPATMSTFSKSELAGLLKERAMLLALVGLEDVVRATHEAMGEREKVKLRLDKKPNTDREMSYVLVIEKGKHSSRTDFIFKPEDSIPAVIQIFGEMVGAIEKQQPAANTDAVIAGDGEATIEDTVERISEDTEDGLTPTVSMDELTASDAPASIRAEATSPAINQNYLDAKGALKGFFEHKADQELSYQAKTLLTALKASSFYNGNSLPTSEECEQLFDDFAEKLWYEPGLLADLARLCLSIAPMVEAEKNIELSVSVDWLSKKSFLQAIGAIEEVEALAKTLTKSAVRGDEDQVKLAAFANQLRSALCQYVNEAKDKNPEELTKLSETFSKQYKILLHSQDDLLSRHTSSWADLRKTILLAVCSLGLALVARLAYTSYHGCPSVMFRAESKLAAGLRTVADKSQQVVAETGNTGALAVAG